MTSKAQNQLSAMILARREDLMETNGSTLHANERRLGPVVFVTLLISLAGGLLFVVGSLGRWPTMHIAERLTWSACTLGWALLEGSNLWYLQSNRKPSIGMIPPAVVALGAAATTSLLNNDTSMWLRATSMALAMLGLVVTILFTGWFMRLRRACANPRPVPADAVLIVLGCGVDHGRPRPTLQLRLDTARDAALAHPGTTLVLTGGPAPDGYGTEAEIMASYLQEQGVDESRMLPERRARNTRENMVYSRELIASRGLEGPYLVVTSDFHVYRAIRQGKETGLELGALSATTPLPGRLQQWSREVLTILFAR